MKKALIIIIILSILGFAGWRDFQKMTGKDSVRKPEQASAIARIDRIETRVLASGVVEPVKRDILKAEAALIVNEVIVNANSVVKSGAKLITFKNRNKSLDAPYDGVIAKVLVSAGDTVYIGQPLIEVFGNKTFLTRIMVDELDLPSIEIGQKAQIVVNAFPNRVFMGKVTDIGQEWKSASGVSIFPVTVTFEEIESIRVGMTTEATIVTTVKEEALVVPIEAVSIVGGDKMVIVETSNGATENRLVETGIYSNIMVEIVSGLDEGEVVQLPQAANDLFQLIPSGFPVQGGPDSDDDDFSAEKNALEEGDIAEDEGVL